MPKTASLNWDYLNRFRTDRNSITPSDLRAVLLDFDGTLSLLREGWAGVMIPMMLEELRKCPRFENLPSHEESITDAVLKLNGQATIRQMEFLANSVSNYGGVPASPVHYKEEYLHRLMQMTNQRKNAIRSGQRSVADFLVPGSRQLLDALADQGVPLLLASGTDDDALKEEATLLDIARYFGDEIHGPKSEMDGFTKAKVTDCFLAKHQLTGPQLLCIGDGYVETQLTKQRGGFAIGIAYDADTPGKVCYWRNDQLVAAGADVILYDLSNLLR